MEDAFVVKHYAGNVKYDIKVYSVLLFLVKWKENNMLNVSMQTADTLS